MTSYGPRLVLGLLATLTLVLSVGGSLGAWPTGAPAAGAERSMAAPRTGAWSSAARPATRDIEGSHGDVRRPDAAKSRPDEGDATEQADEVALPADSGSGRRVVFDMSEQRVWLVNADDRVRRTYLVSGSAVGNLGAGQYEVYSRSRDAVSYDYEETMRYMVRFTQGERAAIGFHDIPLDEAGRPVQTRAQLGHALSAGCIRQARPDAIALWRFAGIGTAVVVVR
jgi:L,D-transpeptidase catalytic domain